MSDKKKYKVMAGVPVLGHEPGEEFTEDIGEDLERRLKDRGAIRVVEAEPTSHTDSGSKEPEGS